jgi:hypothetical protein
VPGFDLNPKSTVAKPATGPVVILREVRSAKQTADGGFERITFEFSGGLPSASVRYVPSVTRCGPGDTLDLGNNKAMLVSFKNTDGHNQQGQSTVTLNLGATDNIKQVKGACDFEAVVEYGVGVANQRPFRVFTLENPPRVVVDIANQ